MRVEKYPLRCYKYTLYRILYIEYTIYGMLYLPKKGRNDLRICH